MTDHDRPTLHRDDELTTRLRTLVAPLLGLFHGAPRGRAWRNAVDVALRAGPDTPATVAALLEVKKKIFFGV